NKMSSDEPQAQLSEPMARWESADADPTLLAQRLRFPYACNVVAPNRFMKSAMSEQMATYEQSDMIKSGIPTRELINLYEKFADGGFGIIITGAIMVNGKDLEAPGNVIIDRSLDSEERRATFKDWTQATKKNGSVFLAQLFHPGTKAADLPHKTNFDINKLTHDQISELVEQYAYAATFSQECGFDGVEISCAYFFALGQFLTHGENTRTDEYGGSLENRARILFRIIQAIRMRVRRPNNFAIGLKLFSGNFEPDYNEDEFGTFIRSVEKTGFDYITITGGRYYLLKELKEGEEITNKHQQFYQAIVPVIKRNLTRTKLYMNGGFVTLADMCEAIRSGSAMGVSLARPVAAEPGLPNKLLNGEVKGAVKSLIDPLDIVSSEQFAGTQLWQHGWFLPVIDASNPEHVEQFKKELEKHQERKTAAHADHTEPVIGYPKVVLCSEETVESKMNEFEASANEQPVEDVTLDVEASKEPGEEQNEMTEERTHRIVKKQIDNRGASADLQENLIEDTVHKVVRKSSGDEREGFEVIEETIEKFVRTEHVYAEPPHDYSVLVSSAKPQEEELKGEKDQERKIEVAETSAKPEEQELVHAESAPEAERGVVEPSSKKDEVITEKVGEPLTADVVHGEGDKAEYSAAEASISDKHEVVPEKEPLTLQEPVTDVVQEEECRKSEHVVEAAAPEQHDLAHEKGDVEDVQETITGVIHKEELLEHEHDAVKAQTSQEHEVPREEVVEKIQEPVTDLVKEEGAAEPSVLEEHESIHEKDHEKIEALASEITEEHAKVEEPTKEITEDHEKVEKPIKEVTEDHEKVEEPTKEITEDHEKVEEPIKEVIEDHEKVEEPTKEITEDHEKVEEPTKEITEDHEKVEEPTKEIIKDHEKVEEPTKEVTEGHEKVEEPTKEVTEDYEKVEEPTKEITEDHEKVEEPTKEITEDHEKVEEPTKEITKDHEKVEEPTKEITKDHEKVEELASEITEDHGKVEEPASEVTEEGDRAQKSPEKVAQEELPKPVEEPTSAVPETAIEVRGDIDWDNEPDSYENVVPVSYLVFPKSERKEVETVEESTAEEKAHEELPKSTTEIIKEPDGVSGEQAVEKEDRIPDGIEEKYVLTEEALSAEKPSAVEGDQLREVEKASAPEDVVEETSVMRVERVTEVSPAREPDKVLVDTELPSAASVETSTKEVTSNVIAGVSSENEPIISAVASEESRPEPEGAVNEISAESELMGSPLKEDTIKVVEDRPSAEDIMRQSATEIVDEMKTPVASVVEDYSHVEKKTTSDEQVPSDLSAEAHDEFQKPEEKKDIEPETSVDREVSDSVAGVKNGSHELEEAVQKISTGLTQVKLEEISEKLDEVKDGTLPTTHTTLFGSSLAQEEPQDAEQVERLQPEHELKSSEDAAASVAEHQRCEPEKKYDEIVEEFSETTAAVSSGLTDAAPEDYDIAQHEEAGMTEAVASEKKSHGLSSFITSALPDSVQSLFSSKKTKVDTAQEEPLGAEESEHPSEENITEEILSKTERKASDTVYDTVEPVAVDVPLKKADSETPVEPSKEIIGGLSPERVPIVSGLVGGEESLGASHSDAGKESSQSKQTNGSAISKEDDAKGSSHSEYRETHVVMETRNGKTHGYFYESSGDKKSPDEMDFEFIH
uniref:NADH:flavin oxidoreductase/NADH oxidase N-terminal domain-containing protein n=1 Tax=Parascaris univalens TaxID=6257 RepID=A0A915BRR1_PARUN